MENVGGRGVTPQIVVCLAVFYVRKDKGLPQVIVVCSYEIGALCRYTIVILSAEVPRGKLSVLCCRYK